MPGVCYLLVCIVPNIKYRQDKIKLGSLREQTGWHWTTLRRGGSGEAGIPEDRHFSNTSRRGKQISNGNKKKSRRCF